MACFSENYFSGKFIVFSECISLNILGKIFQ